MSKVIYFKERTPTPLKVVKDKGEGCAPCFFRNTSAQAGGCPTEREERQAGAGRGCVHEGHHYVEHECAS